MKSFVKIIIKSAGSEKQLQMVSCIIEADKFQQSNKNNFTLGEFTKPQSELDVYLYGILKTLQKTYNLNLNPYLITINLKNRTALYMMYHLKTWSKNKWQLASDFVDPSKIPGKWASKIKLLRDINFLISRLSCMVKFYPADSDFMNVNNLMTLRTYMSNQLHRDYKKYLLPEYKDYEPSEIKDDYTLYSKGTKDDKELIQLTTKTKKSKGVTASGGMGEDILTVLQSDKLRPYLDATPISDINNLAFNKKAIMKRLNMYNWKDVLTFFPNKSGYKNINNVVTINNKADFTDNQPVAIDIIRTGNVNSKTCKNGSIRLSFSCTALGIKKKLYFNSFDLNKLEPLMKKHYLFRIKGIYSAKYQSITANQNMGYIKPNHPQLVASIGKYSSKYGVPQKQIRALIFQTFNQHANEIKDAIPEKIIKEHHLISRKQAIYNCQFPKNKKVIIKARFSEKFYELYRYAYKLQLVHERRKNKPGFSIKCSKDTLNKFKNSLPYYLTHDQKEAIKDILFDLRSPYRMSRLLQGDVGSGKTVVAAFGALAAIRAGYQVALMIPTTVLGGQHYKTFTKFFKHFNINIALLTGKTTYKARKKILIGLKSGQINLIIGTEALYEPKTKYHRLGMAIIDEQQRFGTHQRNALINKTRGCNVLSMTATPIPRTLAIAIFGDMDVSQIRHKPKGRKPIKTKFFLQLDNNSKIVEKYIKQAVKHHEQAFVVTKLVSPTRRSRGKVASAINTFTKLRRILNKDHISVRMIHGRMRDKQKNQILGEFAKHKFDVLVATSVVEVGVDIPHANLMIILNAERYGLSQLHQLRGRVGRNSRDAKCILIGRPKTADGRKRMRVMEKTSNGFKVAQADLKIRHSGNVFGNNQSGLPQFQLADLKNSEDVRMFRIATQDAHHVMRDKLKK